MTWRALLAAMGLVCAVVTARAGLAALPVRALVPSAPTLLDDRAEAFRTRTMSVPAAPWVLVIGGSDVFNAVDPSMLGEGRVRKKTYVRGPPTAVAAALEWDLSRLDPTDLPRLVVWGAASWSMSVEHDPVDCLEPTFLERATPALRTALHCAPPVSVSALHAAWIERDPWYASRNVTRLIAADWLRGPPAPPAPERALGSGQNEAERALRIRRLAELGAFDAEMRDLSERAIGYVEQLCVKLGIPLVFVLMPAHSDDRGHYSAANHAHFSGRLAAQAPVIDLWTSVEDAGFRDNSHTNAVGRAAFSARLAQEIRAFEASALPERP